MCVHFGNSRLISKFSPGRWGKNNVVLFSFSRFSYSQKGKSDVHEFLADIADTSEENAVRYHKKFMKKSQESVHHATLTSVVAILRIALLMSGSNIHVGDMRRLVRLMYSKPGR